MRGVDEQQSQIFSYLSPEARVRKDHPLRAIRAMVDFAKISLATDNVRPENLDTGGTPNHLGIEFVSFPARFDLDRLAPKRATRLTL